jgi:predicted aldo/keto reductase-like oxidoreductase
MERIFSRREFMAMVAAAGATAGMMGSSAAAEQMTTDPVVPRREFGHTGVSISQLTLGGGSFLNTNSQALLDQALKCGVDCWEIVSFSGNAYRDFFKTRPDCRHRVFLTGKVRSTDPAVMQAQLDKLLADNGTSVVDFLAIHTIDAPGLLTGDVRRWAERAKREGKIRFFGFCTHRSMDRSLNAAAGLEWIDGIQTVYNYRLQRVAAIEDAMAKCHEKGIGIFAIKTMGLTVKREVDLRELPLNREKVQAALADAGLSLEQAKLRAVWRSSNVSSICSLMPSPEILQANARAAMDERPLSAETRQLLSDYADGTARFFCRRCGVCDELNTDKIPICDLMEALMYMRAYELKEFAEARWAQIPGEIRDKILSSDYSAAEAKCPQGMPIGDLMKEAMEELGG